MKITKLQELRNFKHLSPAEHTSLESIVKEVQLIDEDLIKSLIKERLKTGHKGTFGHSLIIAGKEGTTGASILCSKAALRTGCGLLTAHVPESAVIPMLVHLPEAMINVQHISESELTKYDAIGFGPGIGVSSESAEILLHLLNNYKGKLVIDADGITILAAHKELFSLLHNNCILTPHPIEFDRLTRSHTSISERLHAQILFEEKYNVHILVKGYNTTVVVNNNVYINTTGNDGMATAGSGDVLTGIITSLCAQGYIAGDAIILGTYLHGYAGDLAAKAKSKHSMLASDIIAHISDFFRKFEK